MPNVHPITYQLPLHQGLSAVFDIPGSNALPFLEGSRVLDAEDAPGLDVPGLDFCALARGYGVEAVCTDTRATFEDALRWSLDASKPTPIEVPPPTIEP